MIGATGSVNFGGNYPPLSVIQGAAAMNAASQPGETFTSDSFASAKNPIVLPGRPNITPSATPAPATTKPLPAGSVAASMLPNMRSHPKQIIIIRHGEKPDGPGRGLSPQGQQRADALATALPQRYPHIDAIIATAPSANSERPLETVTPLANKLGLPINDQWSDKQVGDVAQALTTDPQYDGKTVVVCWHHGKIPELAQDLGVTPPQDPWPSNTFDRIWQVDYAPDGTPSIQNLPQHVLPGDSAQ